MIADRSHRGDAPAPDVCRYPCKHADCCMERGDALPLGMTARWPDGTVYVPRVHAQASTDLAAADSSGSPGTDPGADLGTDPSADLT